MSARRAAARAIFASAAIGCCAACSAGDKVGSLVEVDTLASGRIVVTNHASPDGSRPHFAALTEAFRLGALDGDGPDVFGQVRDVALGPGGELYVFDAQVPEIRVFDSEGTYLRSFGREGQGPGELLRPSGFALDPDGLLWVPNTGNGRYSAFDPATGDVVREEPRLIGFATFPWPGLVDDQGRLVDTGLNQAGEIAILRLNAELEPTDTLLAPTGGEETRIGFRRDGVMLMSMADPFAAEPAWAPRPGGGVVVGEGRSYRIHRIDFGQDTTLTMVLERSPVPVTSAERDSAAAAFQDRAERFASGAVPDRPPRVPDVQPAHGALFVDDVDRTWVRPTTTSVEATVWDVFAPDGRYLGEVHVPIAGSVRPDVRGSRLVVTAEVDGVPTVIVYAMEVLGD